MNAAEQPLFEVTSKARGVRLRQSDIFIEVEVHHSGPVDLFLDECVEKLELRSSGGRDNESGATFFYRFINDPRRVSSCGLAEFCLRVENLYLQTTSPFSSNSLPRASHCRYFHRIQHALVFQTVFEIR